MFLTFTNTLSASFIWGVNTLLLLDAGLSNFEAFVVNAFYSVGLLLFEVPTGIVADTLGRQASYLIGTVVLVFTTLAYIFLWEMSAPFSLWCLVSLFLGLGFTFFSGAVEAWLVDALNFTNFKGDLEDIFAKGQISNGIAMLTGSAAGGFVAQLGNLGTPYFVRSGVLILSGLLAFIFMKDLGFEKRKITNLKKELKNHFSESVEYGLKRTSVRWVMLVSPFIMGVGFYSFYAAQPYLLELYGDKEAYGVAGLAAALVALSQIFGGLIVPSLRKAFSKRSQVMSLCVVMGSISLACLYFQPTFWFALLAISIWGVTFSALAPVKQAYINHCLPSDKRATILSFDGLMGSVGGVTFQPGLGRVADVYNYGTSFFIGGIIQLGALPFVYLAAKANPDANDLKGGNR